MDAMVDGAGHGGERQETIATGPVIVLAHNFSGGGRLRSLLARDPELGCTSGTGILAACDQAATAWRHVEDQAGLAMSQLAISSVRSLAVGMLTVIRARTGSRRWCETIAADPAVAETFLTLFPETRFVCLHRSCPDVVYTAFNSSPWGVSAPGLANHTASYPVNPVAALSAWWAGRTRGLLNFEATHHDACLRIRYEDLVLDPMSAQAQIFDFLGLRGEPCGLLTEDPSATVTNNTGEPGCGAGFPVGQLPPQLLSTVNDLHSRLGYLRLAVPEPRRG